MSANTGNRLKKLEHYLRLIRLQQPAGTFLLLLPCWMGLALAEGKTPEWRYLFFFALGALVMRSSGCIINDIWDRELDANVKRTRTRPLASGALTVQEASSLLFTLLSIGFIILLSFKPMAVAVAVAALPLVATYPYMKRITWWPQVFLGLTFNWGVLVAFMEIRESMAPEGWWLYLALVCWTVGYDTIYALQDKEDDGIAGIKSTALLCKSKVKLFIACAYTLCVVFLLFAASAAGADNKPFLPPAIAVCALHFLWQLIALDADDPRSAMCQFKANTFTGAAMFVGMLSPA